VCVCVCVSFMRALKLKPKQVQRNLSRYRQSTLDLTWIACGLYEGWNFNSGNYLFTTDTK